MKTGNANKRELDNLKIHTKFKLSALWTSFMMLYIYADLYSLYRPGQIDKMISGLMGPFPVTQNSLLMAGILTAIPALMIFLSIALNSKVNRIINICFGIIYTIVGVINLVGETWIYYIVYGITEMFISLMIIYYAWRWQKQDEK